MARELHSAKNCDRPQCAACKKKFGRGSELNRHVKQSHSSVRYSCPVPDCRFKTPRPGKVNEHLKKVHGIDEEEEPKSTNRQMGATTMATSSGSRPEYALSTSLQDNIIATSSNAFDPHHLTFENTEAFDRAASTDTVLGSGQCVHEGDTERVQTPSQRLQLSQNQKYTYAQVGATSAESSSANDLLGATEMLNLGQDHNPNVVTSWMGDPFEGGWTINSWRP
ncbi:hypothetical protein DL98DRAFT_514831 [Cadophora sp. DSE1049]|nr:hypothetical protein DL98DRAFT_514831 [Cadophora sp. DSE1049]